jgi:hypothetical protein
MSILEVMQTVGLIVLGAVLGTGLALLGSAVFVTFVNPAVTEDVPQ